MEKLLGLGLQASDHLIDKYFDKIPDKYFHDGYFRDKVPRPVWHKKTREADSEERIATEDSGDQSDGSDLEEERRSLPPAAVERDVKNKDFEDHLSYSDDDGDTVGDVTPRTRRDPGYIDKRPTSHQKYPYREHDRHTDPRNTVAGAIPSHPSRNRFPSPEVELASYEAAHSSRNHYPPRYKSPRSLHLGAGMVYPDEYRNRNEYTHSEYEQYTPTPIPTPEPLSAPPRRVRSLRQQRGRAVDPVSQSPRPSRQARRLRRHSADSLPHAPRQRSRPREREAGRGSGLKDVFSTSEMGLGAGGLGALAGGLLASEMTKEGAKGESKGWPDKMKDGRFLATLFGSVVGGLVANAQEKEWERSHDKKHGVEKRGTW